MASYRTVISSKGQVVIPAELREQLGLDKGTQATWREENGNLVLVRGRPHTRVAALRGVPVTAVDQQAFVTYHIINLRRTHSRDDHQVVNMLN